VAVPAQGVAKGPAAPDAASCRFGGAMLREFIDRHGPLGVVLGIIVILCIIAQLIEDLR